MEKILQVLGIGLLIVALIAVFKNWDKIFPSAKKYPDAQASADTITENTDITTCQVQDRYGRIITITGNSSDPQFQQMCRGQYYQQYYIYPYIFRGRDGNQGGHH